MNATKQEAVEDLFLWEKMNFENLFFISQDFIYYTGYNAGAYLLDKNFWRRSDYFWHDDT
jgi:hypothetical protein